MDKGPLPHPTAGPIQVSLRMVSLLEGKLLVRVWAERRSYEMTRYRRANECSFSETALYKEQFAEASVRKEL